MTYSINLQYSSKAKFFINLVKKRFGVKIYYTVSDEIAYFECSEAKRNKIEKIFEKLFKKA